jgi:hypothetical protein
VLDARERCIALLLTQRVTEQSAEQADVLAQRPISLLLWSRCG